MRELILSINKNRITSSTDFAGYQGEHNATYLKFELPAELQNQNYTYQANITLPDGITATATLTDMTLPLTSTLTACEGVIQIQLVITETDTLIYKSGTASLKIKPSLAPTAIIGAGNGISSAIVNDDGNLIITLINGEEINAGYVKGDKGDTGSADSEALTSISSGISNLQSRYSKVAGKNIFYANSIVEGEFINYISGTVSKKADYFYTQNAIEIEPNTTYTGSWYNSDGTFDSVMTAFVLFYNSSDEFISGIQLSASANGVFTTPENCYYIRYSGKLLTWNNLLLQIEKGDTCSDSYEAYYNSVLLKPEHIPIDFIKQECNKRSYIYVDKRGNGDYTTVTEAVANAENGATIVVAPGIYDDEIIEAWGKEVHIVGISREACIISNSTASYSTPPIEIGRGSLENLTIIAEYGTGTSTDENSWLPYAVHTEDNNLYNGDLTIRNCTLISELNASFGLGMRGGCTVNIENSHLIGRKGEQNKALYFHDADNVAYAGEQNINIINSLLTSDVEVTTIKIEDQGVEGSSINITMINTLIHNEKGTAYRVGTLNTGGGTYDGWRNLKIQHCPQKALEIILMFSIAKKYKESDRICQKYQK